jgi:hypothetical protein
MPDFIEFANRLGIKEKRIITIFVEMLSGKDQVKQLVGSSFLAKDLKTKYLESYYHRIGRLQK